MKRWWKAFTKRSMEKWNSTFEMVILMVPAAIVGYHYAEAIGWWMYAVVLAGYFVGVVLFELGIARLRQKKKPKKEKPAE